MTWPFENNTNGIVKNLAKRNLKSEKRRNVMVIIAVALAAFLICFTGIVESAGSQAGLLLSGVAVVVGGIGIFLRILLRTTGQRRKARQELIRKK